MFASLENLNDIAAMNKSWENIEKNVKISATGTVGLSEGKQHKSWFDGECLQFLSQRKQAKSFNFTNKRISFCIYSYVVIAATCFDLLPSSSS
jgi:hypothetical protein